MIKFSAYLRLARLDKPVGILLLWYPTAWALWSANKGMPSWPLFFVFLTGTILMRSAGCVINDIADRKIDKHVGRTKFRPLTAGEVSLREAFLCLFLLLLCSLLLLLYLPELCFYFALVGLFITFLYPYCKRYINTPQVVLGVAFSMGIPMAFVASGAGFGNDFIILFVINFAWIIAYDTMYAMTDKPDDLKIGVKSTAIYFADYDRLVIGLLQSVVHGLWLVWAAVSNVNLMFYLIWLLASGVLIYQQKLIRQRIPLDCFKAFLVSSYYGALMWLAVMCCS